MANLLAWYQAHQSLLAGIAPILIAVIDYVIGKNPNSAANGVLHWVELQLQKLVNGNQQPPAK